MKTFWLFVVVFSAIAIIAIVLTVFNPSIWPADQYSISERLSILEIIFSGLGFITTLFAIWFVVHEFIQKQKESNVFLGFENVWIILDQKREKELSRLNLGNEGEISASNFVLEFILDGLFDEKTGTQTFDCKYQPLLEKTDVLSEVTVVFKDAFAYNRIANVPKHSEPDPTGHLGKRIVVVLPGNLACLPDLGIPIGDFTFELLDKSSAQQRKRANLFVNYQIRGEQMKTVQGKAKYHFEFSRENDDEAEKHFEEFLSE